MHKQGFMRTLEAVAAVLMTFVFLLVILPSGAPVTQETSLHILPHYAQDVTFRQCALAQNATCVSSFVTQQLPSNLEYEILFTTNPSQVITLPQKRVFSESLYVTANHTNYNPIIVKLFYWSR